MYNNSTVFKGIQAVIFYALKFYIQLKHTACCWLLQQQFVVVNSLVVSASGSGERVLLFQL